MTGIGRAGKSHVEPAEADSMWGSGGEPGPVSGEARQSFDSVVERMHSRSQDGMAPLVGEPPASDVAVPTRDEVRAAQKKMRGLLVAFVGASKTAAGQARNRSEAQDLIDQVVKAGSEVLDYYASFPPDVARSLLSDDQACGVRVETLAAGDQCNAVATSIVYDLEAGREKAAAVLEQLRKANAAPAQLSRAVSTVAKHYMACMEWWGKKALRSERMQSVCVATASLPGSTPEMLRLHTGWALFTKCTYLQSRIALARLLIESRASTLEPALSNALIGEDGRMRLLGTFINDVVPAFASTGEAVLYNRGAALDAEHSTVLEGVMERLSEFASGVHGIVAGLRDAGMGADTPLDLLDQIEEAAWVTANDVTRFLAVQPKTPAVIEPPANWIPENTGAVSEGQAARKKGKSKRTPAAGEGSSAAGLREAQVARPDAASAPTGKVIVLSDLGTKKLATPEEAARAKESSSTAGQETWRAPPSRKALNGLLNRLDELLQFDLPAQQSAVSQTRQMKPEDAGHIVDLVVKRLQTQAAEIEACVAALEEPRRRGLLTPAQVPEVHEKIVRLKAMWSEVQGQANSLNARKAAITMDCMKTYAFPSQKYLEYLRAADELTSADPPRALKGEPGTLFEIKLQPRALSNGAMPDPVWVHIHTKRPVYVSQLATLDGAEFAACHVKSNEQRGYNRLWQNARAAMGHEDVLIHRGRLAPAFCKSLFSRGGGQPWYPRLEAEFGSMQLARHGM
ncbi:hypothetical protein E3H11_01390 [Bradyrhizobium brasilense]|uniref:hypothetical protein n=1 Tax=Bradyrhizobium brasilense TaxID=1419277 RepID=UPI0014573407|nr:hypothetical protein [Bradyrhizobium brasilense]NLS67624.1 hypothetical protein [Bradyrhizobium brasilense]